MNRSDSHNSNPAAPIATPVNNASSPARNDLYLGALEHWLATIPARISI